MHIYIYIYTHISIYIYIHIYAYIHIHLSIIITIINIMMITMITIIVTTIMSRCPPPQSGHARAEAPPREPKRRSSAQEAGARPCFVCMSLFVVICLYLSYDLVYLLLFVCCANSEPSIEDEGSTHPAVLSLNIDAADAHSKPTQRSDGNRCARSDHSLLGSRKV